MKATGPYCTNCGRLIGKGVCVCLNYDNGPHCTFCSWNPCKCGKMKMNYTKASCGHSVLAVGAPGSNARLAVEGSPCEKCQCPYDADKKDTNLSKQ